MAEQLRHNVVNGSESASALALAGVASNHTIANSASSGSNTIFDHSQNTNGDSFGQEQSSNSLLDSVTANNATNPSAGSGATLATGHEAADGPVIANGSFVENLINGAHEAEHLHGSGAGEDGGIADHSVDNSVHSDTETGKAEESDVTKDGLETSKANAIKRPATFSKVSVTKTFLAKSATPQPAQNKLGDKPLTSSTSTPLLAKPRLVAKTVGNLQNAQKTNLGANGGSGPDASKVWNKNRPVVPTPPKQLTDEQLKQQYGIHLATRLQTNENGKDSTWADIDDDDDDWAPETVVWVDGTKSSLNPAETPTLPVAPAKPASPVPATKPIEVAKPTLVAKRVIDLGPSKTILKPGIAAQQARQQVNGAAPGEKPILKAKSPAPAPARSPWAPIPAVDAVSPVNPPVLQSHPPISLSQPLPPQDARAYEPTPAPQPAREIAADTFERSSLGPRPEGSSRELFNSANGRYEPAPERRSSLRPERKPALLQRPSQNAAQAPEPSVSSRNGSQASGQWARRRESSHSQNSNPATRRISMSKSVDSAPSVEVNDLMTDGNVLVSQAGSASFPKQSPWNAQLPPRPEQVESEQPVEDPVQVQERIMKEKREMAIRRRKEEEEREEADRKERLRIKLNALAGAGKSRKEREAEAAEQKTTDAPATNDPSATISDASQVASVQDDVNDIKDHTPSQTPSVETVTPMPATNQESLSLSPPIKVQPTTSTEHTPVPPTEQQTPQVPRPNASPANSSRVNLIPSQVASYKGSSSTYPSPGERKSQPFGRSPLTNNDAFSPWGTTPSSGNIWGSSGMGNGTFESSSAFAPLPLQNSSILPPPLGMSIPGSARISPDAPGQDGRSTSMQPGPASEPLRSFPSSTMDSRPESSWGAGRAASNTHTAGPARQPHGPGPIAPPSRAHNAQVPPMGSRAAGVAAWNSAARNLPFQYSADAKAAEQKDTEPSPPPQTAIKETFKRTSRDNNGVLGGPRRYEATEFSIHEPHPQRATSTHSPAPPNDQTQPTGPFTTASVPDDAGKSSGRLAPIGPPHRSVLANSSINVNFPTVPLPSILPIKDQSQPPPETSSHPVNNGVSAQPKVKLPPPPPIVKLPPVPPQPILPAVVQQRPLTAWGPPGATRPIAQTPDWQARFNGLFNRTRIHTEVPPSPPGTPPKSAGATLAVLSSSKAFLDEVANLPCATVALPPSSTSEAPQVFGNSMESEIFTKSPIEPNFNEELSFGSLPKVQVPKNPRYDSHVASDSGFSLLQISPSGKMGKVVQPQSIAAELFFYKSPLGYYLRVPGTNLNNVLARHIQDTTKPASASERKNLAKFSKNKRRESPQNLQRGPSSAAETSISQKVNGPRSITSSPSNTAAQESGKKKTTWTKPSKPRTRAAKA